MVGASSVRRCRANARWFRELARAALIGSAAPAATEGARPRTASGTRPVSQRRVARHPAQLAPPHGTDGCIGVSYETLLIERVGPVGWLIFNRPDAGNSMNAQMFDDLEHAWSQLDADT